MKYHVTIGARVYEVVVDGEQVVVDGVASHAVIRSVPGTPIRHLVLDDRSVSFAVIPDGPGRWTLLEEGEAVDVEVLDERTRHIRNMVGEGKPLAAGGVIKAPMPGLVVRVLVEPGQAVTAGMGIVVLEAMKMENELKAAGPGAVDAIAVSPGQAVEKGQVLVSLRAHP